MSCDFVSARASHLDFPISRYKGTVHEGDDEIKIDNYELFSHIENCNPVKMVLDGDLTGMKSEHS